jgi:hypothetical protein
MSNKSPKLKLTHKAATSNDIYLARRDQANAARILEMTLEARARNTDKNYVPKQEEFIAWALRSNYHDRETVTEAKLLSFLEEEVIHRPLRRRGRKALAAEEIELDEQVLKWGSVRGYVTAITDLYNIQKARNMNSNPSPRAAQMRDFIKALQRRDTALAKQTYADKGRDTYLDGYSEAQFKELCLALWRADAGDVGSASDSLKTGCYLRTLVDQCLGHYLLARGHDRRVAEISDIHTFEFPGEGLTPCFPLIMTMRGSKTNQHGRLETMGALRNKDPFVCPLSTLGFYLLYRWDLTQEPFPDFTERSRWYNTRLLLSSRGAANAIEPLSYNTQRDWVSRAFAMIGLNSTKKTHLFRAIGAKLAELKGVTEDQISRAGRWSHDQMTGCYLTCLPHNFMRRMGGHPDQKGCFEIRRAAVTPPDELLKLIWPELDSWNGRFGPQQQEGQINDLAAEGFCTLLHHLRTVILQDSISLREAFPDHPIWSHRVFHHDAYAPFVMQVKSCIGEDTMPSISARILDALPDLVDNLQSISSQMIHQSKTQEHKTAQITSKIDTINIALEKTQETLKHMTSGRVTFRLEMMPQGPATAVVPILPSSSSAPTSPSSSLTSPIPPQPCQPSQPPLDISVLPEVTGGLLLPAHAPLLPSPHPPSVPQYRMRRDIRTVEQLYREWTVGLQGCLSILELDRQYGPRWRAGRSNEIQFYSLRAEIIREINRIALHDCVSEMTAMQRVQGRQYREKWSIDKLCKALRMEASNRKRNRA